MLLKIKEWLQTTNPKPTLFERTLCTLYDLLYFLRVQKPVTALFGPMYHRSYNLIELDLTYACNLKCISCNRSCGLAPSDDRLNLEQIQRFIRESISMNVSWKRIRLLGGEPTMHPDLPEIVAELDTYARRHCPDAVIELVTNGFGSNVEEILGKIGKDVRVVNTMKTSKTNMFLAFNVAPMDLPLYHLADFSSGCWVPEYCGINLSPYGYYCCGAGAGIDRVFGFNIGKKSLPDQTSSLRDQMKVLCGYCMHFKATKRGKTSREQTSPSWRTALEKYRTRRPNVDFY
jgi:hypothetical protein